MQNSITDLSKERDLPLIKRTGQTGPEQLRTGKVLPISKSIYAHKLSINDMMAEDIILLDKAVKGDYHEVTTKDILDGLVAERFQVWRLGQGDGIAVTAIQPYPGGTELYVAYLAGAGYISHFGQFNADMERFARAHKCRWFAGMAQSKGLEKLYWKVGQRLGAMFIREIKYE